MASGLFSQLISMGMTASWVILVVLAVRLLFQRLRLPKKYSYYLWAVPALRLICPVSVSSAFSLFNVDFIGQKAAGIAAAVEWLAAGGSAAGVAKRAGAGLASGAQGMAQGAGTAANALNAGGTVAAGTAGADIAGAAGNAAGNIPAGMAEGMIQKVLDGITGGSVSAADLLHIASWVWLAGLAAILLYSLFCWLRLRRTVHMAVRLQDNVYECGNISSPFVLGLFGPRIYLPFRLSEREREYIIRHEEFHIRRKDVYVKALAFFLAAVYWFHPFVWLAFFCMGRDMEMSCDEHVLVEMGSGIKKEYSLSLLSFASNRRLHPAGPLSFGEKDAKSRVKNILGFRKPGVWAAVGGTLMILVIAAVCLTNGTGGADGAGTDKAEINGTEINSAGINGTEETAGTPETAGTVNRTEDGQPESSMSQEGSREDAVLPDIHEVMGRVFENCWKSRRMLSFGDVVPEDGDYMVRLAATEDGLYEAYGCVSPEYGYRGIYMNFRLDGMDNINEVDAEWVNLYDGPKLSAGDYDGDGRDEAALAFLVGSGTGLYLEKLLVFETYDTAHMDPYELSGEKLEEEIGRLLDYRVDTAKKTVDITERETGRVIVGGLSYKLEDNEDAGFGGVSYGSHIRYALGDQIYLYAGVGIMNSVFPEPGYPGKDVAFRVIYEDPEIAGKDCFRLADPAEGVYGVNAEANGEEAAGFDVREVLVPVEEVADIRVTNGNTGTVFMVGTQEEKEQILEAYAALDIRPEEALQQRIGYSYRIQLLDADGNVLQNVTPYKDAVTLDGEIYDGSMNQTTTALLLAESAAREG